ncbi:MAG: hypothetical protein ACRDRV_01945 [Pseudonocardiaceae bacterium]
MRGPQDEVIPLHAPFEIVLRGFNRQQVIDHIESLEGHIAMMTADRDAALRQTAELSRVLDHLRREAEEATTRLHRMQRSSLGGAGVRIQHMLQAAEDEITAQQAAAEQEARAVRERARAEAESMLREATARRERQEAESARRCQRAEQESEQRRRMAQQQSEQDIARRQAGANHRITEYQTRGIAALHQVLLLAGQQLSSRVAEVEREVARFTELRAEVTARLSSAHRALVEAVGQAHQPTAEELDTQARDTGVRDTGVRDTESRDTESRDTEGRDTEGRDTEGRDSNTAVCGDRW